MRVVIPDWLVVDEEIAVPASGAVLRNLGLRLLDYAGAIKAPTNPESIRGRVTWLRHDEANELFEMAIDTGEWAVLAQEGESTSRAAHQVGDRVNLAGRLLGVAAYEYEDFALPDVRADWLVESASQNEETLEWHVDLNPAG